MYRYCEASDAAAAAADDDNDDESSRAEAPDERRRHKSSCADLRGFHDAKRTTSDSRQPQTLAHL